ncbi:YueI family protein [Lacticaseibacillus brantae]|uniref:DUF1694 domain-containing protein n=1 Tax=Lacticaseibacillus brantae DSM 23927 TaxID=1423727 RepID=A0A0R2B2E3_9LACO|nr:YueI family protein [Lacticaseibacillus brantae]KRM72914.1 hypothetical protein FC34_GL000626 [Lacticaseibacillus brantae DSM 23927]
MADDDLQAHLNKSIYGTPQTNPDERRRYLGSLRERVVLEISNTDIVKPDVLTAFQTALPQYVQPTYQALINGKQGPDVTAPFIKAVNDAGLKFTLVNDDTASLDPSYPGLLIVAPDAINHDDISLPATDTPSESTAKDSHPLDIFHLFDKK